MVIVRTTVSVCVNRSITSSDGITSLPRFLMFSSVNRLLCLTDGGSWIRHSEQMRQPMLLVTLRTTQPVEQKCYFIIRHFKLNIIMCLRTHQRCIQLYCRLLGLATDGLSVARLLCLQKFELHGNMVFTWTLRLWGALYVPIQLRLLL